MPIFVAAMPKWRCSPATFARPVTFPCRRGAAFACRCARLRAHDRSLACAVARAGLKGARRRAASGNYRGVGDRRAGHGQRRRLDLAARDRHQPSGRDFRTAYWFCRGTRGVIEWRVLAAPALARDARAADRIGAKSGGSWCGGIRRLLCGARRIQRPRATIDVDARASSRSRCSAGAGPRLRWCLRGRWGWCCWPIHGR